MTATNPNQQPQPPGKKSKWGFAGKTVWDWLDLFAKLAIPLVVVGATIAFGIIQADQGQKQHESDKQQVLDQQRATILQTYIDNIQDLLLNHNLLKSKPDDDVAVLARARTLTALQGLDSTRKGVLIQFLYEAHLIGFLDNNKKQQPSVIDLTGANLNNAFLNFAELNGAYLNGAELNGAALVGAYLNGAHLVGAYPNGADLSEARLSNATLVGAHLRDASLIEANLYGANLSGADLNGAKVTNEQLAQAFTLAGATMPDGSKHP